MPGAEVPAVGEPAEEPRKDEPLVDEPLSLEVLAELHAGALDDRLAARLRLRVATDPQARSVLAALDATVADLAAVARQRAVRMPDDVAQRLDATLAAQAQHSGRRRRGSGSRSWTVGAGLLAAAAALVAVVTAGSALPGLPGLRWEIAGTPQVADPRGSATGSVPAPPLALTRATLGGAVDTARVGRDFGPLSTPAKLRQCLAANDVDPASEPIGGLRVTLDGQPGVLIVLPTGRLAQFRLLVVSPACGPGNPARLADSVVGHR